jgi:1-phosphatidylinositol-4-phosphate 5-kinase
MIVGNGEMKWSDGSKYVGEFVNGKMDGHGIKTWANGDKFTGMWKNNL